MKITIRHVKNNVKCIITPAVFDLHINLLFTLRSQAFSQHCVICVYQQNIFTWKQVQFSPVIPYDAS